MECGDDEMHGEESVGMSRMSVMELEVDCDDDCDDCDDYEYEDEE